MAQIISALANLELVAGDHLRSGANTQKANRWFWAFALSHFVFWTLLPVFTQPNVPLDVVEITYWGHEWQLGYPKHPPLPSWLAEGAYVASGHRVWAIYALAQSCMLACFWSVWQLARHMLSPIPAVLAVLVLEGCCFFTFNTPEFNHAICLNAFCGLSALYFYRALREGRLRHWALTGLFVGLGMLSKYNMATLASSMFVVLVWDRSARRAWRTLGPYLALVVAIAVISPHVYWAVTSGMQGINYLLQRTQTASLQYGRLTHPAEFALGQLLVVVPVLISVFAGLAPTWTLHRPADEKSRFDLLFVSVVGFGPFIQAVLVSFSCNMNLRMSYGMSLWMFLGLWLLLRFKPTDRPLAWPRVARLAAVFAMISIAITVGRNLAGPALQGKGSRIHFPGADLAFEVERIWHETFQEPLPVAAGEWWLAGNVSFYGRDRASVYCGGYYPETFKLEDAYGDSSIDQRLRTAGGALIWNVALHGRVLPESLAQRYPVHTTCEVITFPWKAAPDLPPIEVAVSLIPPANRQAEFRSTHFHADVHQPGTTLR